MGRSGSWGQGRGWSLAGSEVRPAPFSWGSQIVAMWGGGGVSKHLPRRASSGPGIPAARGPLPPSPQPQFMASATFLSACGPSEQPSSLFFQNNLK